MSTLDFRKRKKMHLNITLPDEENTRLSVLQPTKEMFEKVIDMSTRVAAISGTDLKALDEVYEVCAELISRNQQQITLTKEDLERILDFEDVFVLLQTYSNFVAAIVAGKN